MCRCAATASPQCLRARPLTSTEGGHLPESARDTIADGAILEPQEDPDAGSHPDPRQLMLRSAARSSASSPHKSADLHPLLHSLHPYPAPPVQTSDVWRHRGIKMLTRPQSDDHRATLHRRHMHLSTSAACRSRSGISWTLTPTVPSTAPSCRPLGRRAWTAQTRALVSRH